MKTKRGPRYTPVSRRQDRPNAILWLLKNHPELKDSQIMRLVGTTKPTIIAIRERGHWNSPNLVAQDPVTLGLCSQIDLDAEVKKAAARLERERQGGGHRRSRPRPERCCPTEETTAALLRPSPSGRWRPRWRKRRATAVSAPEEEEDAPDVESVFAKLKDLKHSDAPSE